MDRETGETGEERQGKGKGVSAHVFEEEGLPKKF